MLLVPGLGVWILDSGAGPGSPVLDPWFWILNPLFWILDLGSLSLDSGFWVWISNSGSCILDIYPQFWILESEPPNFGLWILDSSSLILDLQF